MQFSKFLADQEKSGRESASMLFWVSGTKQERTEEGKRCFRRKWWGDDQGGSGEVSSLGGWWSWLCLHFLPVSRLDHLWFGCLIINISDCPVLQIQNYRSFIYLNEYKNHVKPISGWANTFSLCCSIIKMLVWAWDVRIFKHLGVCIGSQAQSSILSTPSSSCLGHLVTYLWLCEFQCISP